MLPDQFTAFDLMSHDQTPTLPASRAMPTASESGKDRSDATSASAGGPGACVCSRSGTASCIVIYFPSRVAANSRSPQLSSENRMLPEALGRQAAAVFALPADA